MNRRIHVVIIENCTLRISSNNVNKNDFCSNREILLLNCLAKHVRMWDQSFASYELNAFFPRLAIRLLSKLRNWEQQQAENNEKRDESTETNRTNTKQTTKNVSLLNGQIFTRLQRNNLGFNGFKMTDWRLIAMQIYENEKAKKPK